jgi:methylglutaconyl-CoA hydratase
MHLVVEHHKPPIASVSLNDPAKRNAMSLAMFDALDAAVTRIAADDSVHVVLLRGEGPAFCSGFDLAAAVDDPDLLPQYVRRLSGVMRSIRRMPQVVLAAVHGAAIAGGCALLSTCDFVFVAPDAKVGYPVHALGISPAVTIPTLRLLIGDGPARALLMSGELIDGVEARRIGLATHLAATAHSMLIEAEAHARLLTQKGPHALRTTKGWLNELDGSLDDRRFAGPAENSAVESAGAEARRMLRAFWASRRK